MTARIALLAAALCALLAPAAQAVGPAKTKRVLAQQMAHAGSGSGAYVVDMDTGQPLFADDPDTPRIPASVEKLYTSATALLQYGANGTLTTSVLADTAPDPFGVVAGNVYLRGGGDPSFNATAARRLARDLIKTTGLTEITGRVVGDESAFDGLRGPPSEGFTTSIWVGPLSALTFNRGFTGVRRPLFQRRPPLFAAKAFTKALRRRGVRVARAARVGVAPGGAPQIASWFSPTMAALVGQMNPPSDNFMAETLIKALGMTYRQSGTTAAGAEVVRETAATLGAPTYAVDGSGLSRANRTSPRAVVSLLLGMAESEVYDEFASSLPIAGRTGTLHDRMRRTAARDACRAKTGTLSNVSALAGYCETRDGGRVAFAFLMNGVWPTGARTLQDRMTTALARYNG
jgi:D-alanyl-D-alanine carboxypeptidase/D-alanyl-D-alanine-endopeptidase (penicillin-binding protein 4)